MLRLTLILAILISSTTECFSCSEADLAGLVNKKLPFDAKADLVRCLSKNEFNNPEVARALLKILRDANQDLFLREEVAAAVAEPIWRKKIRVEGPLGPKVGEMEKNAVAALPTGNAGVLLNLTQAVNSMEETIRVSRFESDYMQALAEIALNESNHILFRSAAVDSMEKISKHLQDSGLYEEKVIRFANETVRTLALREDIVSYNTGAVLAYERMMPQDASVMLAQSNTKDSASGKVGSRGLASVPAQQQTVKP